MKVMTKANYCGRLIHPGLLNPEFWLFILIALYPLQLFTHITGLFTVIQIVEVILFFTWFLQIFITRKICLNIRAFYLAIFFLVSLLTSFLLFPNLSGLVRLFTFIGVILLFTVTMDIFNKNPLVINKIIEIIIIDGFIVAIIGIIMRFYSSLFSSFSPGIVTLYAGGGIRSAFLFSNPNVYGYFLLVVFLLLQLKLTQKNSQKYAKYLSVMSFIVILAIYYTFSRGIYLGLIFCSVFLLFRGKRENKLLILLSFLILTIYISLSSSNQIFLLRIEKLGEITEPGPSSNWARYQMIFISLKIWLHHSIFGIGLANLVTNPDNPLHIVAHNMYLNVLTETGILGMIPFLSLIFISFRSIVRSIKIWNKLGNSNMYWLSSVLKILFLTLLFVGLFSNSETNKLLWMFMSVNFVMEYFAKKEYALRRV